MTWQDLRPAEPHRNGVPVNIQDEELWANDQYVVHKKITPADDPEVPDMIWLSIRRQDRQPARDWRDFQRIKNQLAGPEWEAVEIYPAESRKVDGANQYHLWCFQFTLGFGFNQRVVANSFQSERTAPGSVQRDPEPVDLKYGGLTPLKKQLEMAETLKGTGYGMEQE